MFEHGSNYLMFKDIIPSCGFSNHFWWFKFQNTLCFFASQFLCVMQVFFWPWFCVLSFSILCFGLGILLIVGESYFGLGMMCQLGCFYVILCDASTKIGVGTNMVLQNNH